MTKIELQRAILKAWRPCCHYGDFISVPSGTIGVITQCCEIDWKPNQAAAFAALAEELKIEPSDIEVDEEVSYSETYNFRFFLKGVHIGEKR